MKPLNLLILVFLVLGAGSFGLGQETTKHSTSEDSSSGTLNLVGSGWQGRIPDQKSIDGQLIERTILFVRFRPTTELHITTNENGIVLTGIPKIDELNQRYECIRLIKRFKGKTKYRDYDADKAYKLQFRSKIDMVSARSLYLSTGYFESVDYNLIIEVQGGSTSFTPNDARYPRQWGLNNDSVTLKANFPSASVRLGEGMVTGIPVKSIQLRLYNIKGQIVHEATVRSQSLFELFLPETQGLYFYEVIVNDRYRGTGKLMKAG